ncbi:PQQ-binding-like beta-propeller repeat protein [bacterium]|nr:PQQ-binding-like beta-propeller repeat protein [bacterium]
MRINVIIRSSSSFKKEPLTIQIIDPKDHIILFRNLYQDIEAGTTSIPIDFGIPDNFPPGEYLLKVISKTFGRDTFEFRVNIPKERGRFKMFTASNLGSRWFPPDFTIDYVRIMAEDGITHDVTIYPLTCWLNIGEIKSDIRTNAYAQSLLLRDYQLPAPETAELPSRMRLALIRLSAHGIRFWPVTMGWEVDPVVRTPQQQIRDKMGLARRVYLGLKYPCQDGFLWNESNWWKVDRNKLIKEWSRKTGWPANSLKRHIERQGILLSGKDLKAALSFHEFMAKKLYPESYRRWEKFVEEIRKDITSAGSPDFYYINWPVWCSEPLEGIMCYHQVEQICEPYMLLNDCAFVKRKGKKFWAGLEIFPESGTGEYLTRQLLPALLYGVEGFWVNSMHGYQQYLNLNPGSFIRESFVHQAVSDIRNVLEPVGTRLRNTDYYAELGIYFPRAAWVQGGRYNFAGDVYHKRVSAALIASFYAHIPAKIIFDEDLKEEKADVKVLLLPGLKCEITTEDLKSLQNFKLKGGIIILGKGTSPFYNALGKETNLDFSIFKDYDYVDWFTTDNYIEKRERLIFLANEMKKTLAPYIKPPLEIEDPDIWYSLLKGKDNTGRDLTCLVAINQNFPEGFKPCHLWKMTSVFHTVLPVYREVKVPSEFLYAYDLLGGKPLEIKDRTIPLDFRRFPARIIALSSYPLKAEHLREKKEKEYKRTGEKSMKLNIVSDVDVFFPEKISRALKENKKIYVMVDRRFPYPNNIIVEKLKEKGLQVSSSLNPQEENGIHLLFSSSYRDSYEDILPIRLTKNIPGKGKAFMTFLKAYLPGARDTIFISSSDREGVEKSLNKIVALSKATKVSKETRLIPPRIREGEPSNLLEDTTKIWGGRLTTVKVAGDTVAVGAAEWGNNLFLLDDENGKLRVCRKAGRFYVDKLWISKDGEKIGAEAIYPEDVNGYLELYDKNGNPIARFARDGINSLENRVYTSNARRKDIFDFAISPDGNLVYSSSNLGLSAIRDDGKIIWRHDYRRYYTNLEILLNKWAGRIDLTPDGKYLGVALTHELCGGSIKYDGFSRVRKVDALTGQILWEKIIQNPNILDIKISPDGKSIAILDSYYGLVILRDGKIIKKRAGKFKRICWSKDSKKLYVIGEKTEGRTFGFRRRFHSVLALDCNGIPLWQFDQSIPIIALTSTDDGKVVFSDTGRKIKLLSNNGKILWTISLEATGNIYTNGEYLYACDWHGNVYKFSLSSGKLLWKNNLTDHIWRDDIEKLPNTPFSGKTFKFHKRKICKKPMEGNNIATEAKVKVEGIGAWFTTPRLLIEPQKLIDGRLNNLEKPWMSFGRQFNAGNNGSYVWAEFSWPYYVFVKGLSIHEDERYPESWPYDCCVQIWDGEKWIDAGASIMCSGPWHNLLLNKPVMTKKLRYCVTSILSNNLWTDEIRVIEGDIEETDTGLWCDIYYVKSWDNSVLNSFTIHNSRKIKSIRTTLGGFSYNELSKLVGRREFYILSFHGKIFIPEDGTFEFKTISDDGLFLKIGEKEVINDWTLGRSKKYGKVELKKGWHEFKMKYFQAKGLAMLEGLKWKKKGDDNFKIIPPFYLKIDKKDTSEFIKEKLSENLLEGDIDTGFDKGINPFKGRGEGTTRIISINGNNMVEFSDISKEGECNDSCFSLTLGKNSSLVKRINEIYNSPVGSKLVDFVYEFKLIRLRASNAPVSKNILAMIEFHNWDNNLIPRRPVAGPSFFSLPGYKDKKMKVVNHKVFPNFRFTIIPNGGKRKITGITFTFIVRVARYGNVESYGIDDLAVYEVIPLDE